MWDLLASGRQEGKALPPELKTHILEFLGDAEDPGPPPLTNAEQLRLLSKMTKKKLAADIRDNILAMCRDAAKEQGAMSIVVSYREALANVSPTLVPTYAWSESATGTKNWWRFLFLYFSDLRDLLRAVGLSWCDVEPKDFTQLTKTDSCVRVTWSEDDFSGLCL